VIKIGDFARLSHVSVVTLRHYDEIGLLTPVAVDDVTGYRYYAVTQLPRLNRILALKDLGFSLEQIAPMLHDGITPAQLGEMLTLKRKEVERHITEERARLARIAARLRNIEKEDHMADYDVVLKTVPPLLSASHTVTIPTNGEVPAYLNAAFAEVYSHVKQRGAKENGPCLALWHQPAAVHVNEEAEAAVQIDRPIPGTDRVMVYTLPVTEVVSIVHQGAFSDFRQAHATLLEWIDANGYRVAGAYREVYMQHDPSAMAEAATEIQYPVAQAV
jgi:DNA-binding transcriptional MerR regulator